MCVRVCMHALKSIQCTCTCKSYALHHACGVYMHVHASSTCIVHAFEQAMGATTRIIQIRRG